MIKIKLLFISIIPFFIFILGCQEKGTEFMDEKIEESSELEEYIIAGLDFQHSLNEFKQQLKSVDMLSLQPTLDSKGNLIITIPTKVNIEEKAKYFNQKKKVLIEKYPELKNLKPLKRQERIEGCINSSLKIAKALIEFEYIFDQPRLKSSPGEYCFDYFSDENGAFNFLNQQIADPNYMEVTLVVFENGTIVTVTSDINDEHNSYISLHQNSNTQKWYLCDVDGSYVSMSAISYTAHTHNTPDPASDQDIESQAMHPGLPMYIYHYGGLMYDVDGNIIR